MTLPLRRRTLLTGGATLAGLALAGCSGSTGGSAPGPTASTAHYTGDLAVAALGAALENLATDMYDLALSLAGRGSLGAVPPALATLLTTVRGHHADHARTWNAILTDARLTAVTSAATSIQPTTAAAMSGATTPTAVIRVLVSLEQMIAATHLAAAGSVTDAGAITAAAAIVPVEAMHAAVLDAYLGNDPVPADVLSAATAVGTGTLTA